MPDDDGFRTPIFSSDEKDYAQGMIGAWIICSPHCPTRPEGAQVFTRRPSMNIWKTLSQAEQTRLGFTL